MPGASVAILPPTVASTPSTRKTSLAPERKYKCQFCNRAFSRSEHRSRHERSHTKERPFKCMKCRSTFVRRDLLLRHDRTVHAKDGGIPLHSDGKRRAGASKARAISGPSKPSIALDTSTIEQIEAVNDDSFGIEAAAILVAHLQDKAAPVIRGDEGAFEDGPSVAYSPCVNSVIHSTGTYPSRAIALPKIPWEGYMPPSAAQPKTHSIASSASGSFDSRQSLVSESIPQQSVDPVALLGGQGVNGLVPALQNMIKSLPNSGPATPAPQSPTTPQLSSAGFKTPQVEDEDERKTINDKISSYDCEHAIPEGFRLPGLSSLNRYLSTYFSMFHHHLPFLHPASFHAQQVSPPLLLAVLSIGALYAFDQDQAYMLHIGSKVLVNQFLQNKENFSSRKCPLWTMQSSLLNMIFASWSGDPKGLEWACSIKSLLANMVAGNRYELKLRQEARGNTKPVRCEWIEDEGCRRTYYAVYIFFGLLTLTYNHTPAISFNEFEDLQLPATEALWNLQLADEAAWLEHLISPPSATFMEAHDNLFQGETLRYSAFATRVMINALFLEVWYHKRSPEALQDVVTEYKLRLALETWLKSLESCEPESVAVPLSAPHQGHHPLIFNATAMYRNARVRLEVDLKSVQEALRYHDSYEVAAAMLHARDRVKRSSEMVKVIQECYSCIETAVLQGIRWVARTSPTNWSVEHPLCGLDLMIILSLWLYRLEHDEEPATRDEMEMYSKVQQLLNKELEDGYVSQLSSVVARVWGSMLDEVVVWGITRLMGHSFELHSQALVGYVDDHDASSNISTPSMTSQGADEDSVY
ncbi:hypothetical protein CDD82_1110 [Ophiocordyceps australis]|uniref:C2H2-type domain-containing protein n=1 Tax=Ophiocordyceps australis TaxID=1399860 RepID=A0A2C5XPH2_9HYPO|nr:hypothetical protein CDD82_1110 [Ophiocordyceps australis]